MAKCDEGYICEICGEEVENITQSDLYLRFVIGELDPELLHVTPERHIRCNPILAQFIDDPGFLDLEVEPGFSMRELDPAYVRRANHLLDGHAEGYDIGRRKSFDIDSELDFEIVQYLLQRKQQMQKS